MEPPGRAGVGPRIQYAKTADGVNTAYWAIGEGPALVLLPTHAAPTDVEWRIPPMRSFYQQLARNRLLVRYDGRGTGMSDREARDFSLDARMRDLDAVAGRLELQRFALWAATHSGPTAIAYAATRPERVSHLVFYSSWVGAPSIREVPALQAILGLLDSDWILYTETVAHWLMGWSEGELAHAVAAAMRESMSHEVAKAALRAHLDMDVRHLLPQVRAPALVFHVRDGPVPVKITQELVTAVPNARLVVLEGSSVVGPQAAAAIAAIDEFLGEGEAATRMAEPPAPGAFRTVLFTDLVGHTEMMSRLGDERGRAVLREHERITREVLKAHGGTEVKTMGDGFMASFSSVTKAVECAVALQRAFAEREGEPLSVRVGLNAGEPIEEDGDLFGAAVILAARIAAEAEGGEILVANAVRELCAGKGFVFSDRGEFVAKGFEEPVRVYEVRWRE